MAAYQIVPRTVETPLALRQDAVKELQRAGIRSEDLLRGAGNLFNALWLEHE